MIVPVRQEGVEHIIRRLSVFKIEGETLLSECWWDVFTEEVLPRLTADHLEILKTVCKNWFQIISSPYFVGLHLNNVYNQGQIRVLTIPLRNSAGSMREYKYNINCDDVETKQIPFSQPKVSKILGSCDGLLCLLLVKPNQIGVYNPSTAKYFLVQPSPKYNYKCSWFGHKYNYKCSWFGHHPSSGEYILVLIFWDDDLDWKVGVYKFSGGSGSGSTLELIHSTPCFISPQFPDRDFVYSFQKRGTLFQGALHWPAMWIDNLGFRLVICTYNLDHNKYSELSLPDPVPDRLKERVKLGVNAEGCLFVIFNSENAELMEMWVMKEYGVEESWTKHANIVGPYRDSVLSPLGLFPNGDLILDANKLGLYKYNFNDNKLVRLIKYHDYSRPAAIVCVDSLVCPTIVLGRDK